MNQIKKALKQMIQIKITKSCGKIVKLMDIYFLKLSTLLIFLHYLILVCSQNERFFNQQQKNKDISMNIKKKLKLKSVKTGKLRGSVFMETR